jgi:NAD(P)-dependent dehydrogenase (short-subunit alcohol dehydrogenase family)
MTEQSLALITGASRGLGLEVARQLGGAGIRTLVGARNPETGERAVAGLRRQGLEAEVIALDVDSKASIAAAARRVADDHGRLDILVNNAGILPEATAPEATRPLDVALFKKTFETNLFGAVAVTQSFLPLLQQSPAGRIVNVSSTMGSLSDQTNPSSPYYGLVMPAYQTSKAALNGLTIALAKALADTPIKVSSVCPGWVQTISVGPRTGPRLRYASTRRRRSWCRWRAFRTTRPPASSSIGTEQCPGSRSPDG